LTDGAVEIPFFLQFFESLGDGSDPGILDITTAFIVTECNTSLTLRNTSSGEVVGSSQPGEVALILDLPASLSYGQPQYTLTVEANDDDCTSLDVGATCEVDESTGTLCDRDADRTLYVDFTPDTTNRTAVLDFLQPPDAGTYVVTSSVVAGSGNCSATISVLSRSGGTVVDLDDSEERVQVNLTAGQDVTFHVSARQDVDAVTCTVRLDFQCPDDTTFSVNAGVGNIASVSFARALGSDSDVASGLLGTDGAEGEGEHMEVSLSKETLLNLWGVCAVVIAVNVALCAWCHCRRAKKEGNQRFVEDQYVSDVNNV